MFRWYLNAVVCYAYMEEYDVELGSAPTHFHWDTEKESSEENSSDYEESGDEESQRIVWQAERCKRLSACRWFTRGWTLQELIVPRAMKFFDDYWSLIRGRQDMLSELAHITGIDRCVLDWARDERLISYGCWSKGALRSSEMPHALSRQLHKTLSTFSIAQRMSWASGRRTTRTEDEAYALLGIFDVNMPLLYGDGSKAFPRLQEEIIRTSTDRSILAWTLTDECNTEASRQLFAPNANCFKLGANIESRAHAVERQSYEMTNLGLRITLPVLDATEFQGVWNSKAALLNCGYRDYPTRLIIIVLRHARGICDAKRTHLKLPYATVTVAKHSAWQTVTISRDMDEVPDIVVTDFRDMGDD